jgi:hypothetical protein
MAQIADLHNVPGSLSSTLNKNLEQLSQIKLQQLMQRLQHKEQVEQAVPFWKNMGMSDDKARGMASAPVALQRQVAQEMSEYLAPSFGGGQQQGMQPQQQGMTGPTGPDVGQQQQGMPQSGQPGYEMANYLAASPQQGMQQPGQLDQFSHGIPVTRQTGPMSKAQRRAYERQRAEDIRIAALTQKERQSGVSNELKKTAMEQQQKQFESSKALQEKQFAAKTELEKKKMTATERRQEREARLKIQLVTEPQSEEMAETRKRSDRDINRWKQTIDALERGDVRVGQEQILLEKLGMGELFRNKDTEFVHAALANEAQGFMDAFHIARPNQKEFEAYERSNANAHLSKDQLIAMGKAKIMQKQAQVIEDDERIVLKKENGGVLPLDWKQQVRDRTKTTVDNLRDAAMDTVMTAALKRGVPLEELVPPQKFKPDTVITVGGVDWKLSGDMRWKEVSGGQHGTN